MPGKFLARAQSCAFAAIVASMVFDTVRADEISWGQPGEASTIVTHPGEGAGHVASLVFTNRLNGGSFYLRRELFEGARIVVTIRDQSGDVPDELTVEVPDGYLAIPPVISVEEDSSGTVEIFEASEVPLS